MATSTTPHDFVTRWRNTSLSERASYQMHFLDLCRLVGHETPTGTGVDSRGLRFEFEAGIKKESGGQGFADVFYENHFAIEYKAPNKYRDLSAAYQQLLQYREKLNNPPLLIVTDIAQWQIYTNWTSTETKVYQFTHEDIATKDSVQRWLRAIFSNPEHLHPRRNTEEITKEAARGFQIITDTMREDHAAPERIAHFLTKLVFCLFAEDVALLPPGPRGQTGVFSEIVERTVTEPKRFVAYVSDLFQAMNDGGEVLFARIPWFNGSLFKDVNVETLTYEALSELEKASRLNWKSVEPSIFGTLFERVLDPAKRAQLGAHYTSRDDITLIVEPVLMQPLRREWAALQTQARPLREAYDAALKTSNQRQITAAADKLKALRGQMLDRLRRVRVLDPACGSGNFLYVSLQLLMDMEKQVLKDELFAGMDEPFPEVHPRQMFGIERDPIAHALASIVVWIGYIQWRQNNGYWQAYGTPILQTLEGNIICNDAIMRYRAADDGRTPYEPDWPQVDVIVGNPPFLGGSKLRGELGDSYYEALTKLYKDRVPGFADLVCYWFEKARAQIEQGKTQRAGLLATNSIRGGANREVLKRIKATGDLFMAHSDREWILDGAAVRVSMVGFDDGSEKTRTLDGLEAEHINSDLTGAVDIISAVALAENETIAFRGNQKGGPFDIDAQTAKRLIESSNTSRLSNRDVVRPWWNGLDITRGHRNMWLIDFGPDMPFEEAQKYEEPLEYVRQRVKPLRDRNNRKAYRERWWIHNEPRPTMRLKLASLSRYLVTPHVSKHRLFVWLDKDILPDHQLIAFAREDDYFFGVLHSKLHEVWSLRMGTWLGKGNDPRYTPTTTFETFPFPWPPGAEERESAAYERISAAARSLDAERGAWLNPAGGIAADLKQRTLTNLYNALVAYREQGEKSRDMPQGVKIEAWEFAPRLAALHDELDAAVCAAYGWPQSVLADEEAMLRHLLALNQARA